ncbi:hypothetical protein ACJMK2_029041 [Sinanodonta woodiana]|uniref:C1q domain-containing protein n=1 Tax=Sinanodonta woodiana TaxID=1069815 RepID=A0ABD3X8Y5_SINWO
MMRTTALIICVLVIPVQTAVLEPETVIEYLLRKVSELESNQHECSRYQSKMILELSYVKDKLEQSERRILDLEAIVYEMKSAEYTDNLSVSLEKDPVYKSTNETETKLNTEETNITHKPDIKVMTSHKPGILRRDVRLLTTNQIAFCATIANLNGLGPIHPREIVLFDTVLLNEGNGFNKQTGIFTCPLSGIYFFTGSVLTQHEHQVGVHLIVNGETKGNAYADGANSWDQGSISSIARCEAGQNVWISVYYGTYIHGNYYTSFSGFLLWGMEVADKINR